MKDIRFRLYVEQLSILSLIFSSFLLWGSLAALKHSYDFEIELILNFWSVLSGSPFMATFLGAVAGSGTILFMNYKQEQNRILSEICAARAIFSGHITNLINLKRQYLIQSSTDIEHNGQSLMLHKKLIDKGYKMPPLKIIHGTYYSFISEISNDYVLSFDAISKHAGKDSNVLIFAVKAKETLNSVAAHIKFKNELVQKFRQELNNSTSENVMHNINFRILGVPSSTEGNSFSDSVFYETVNNLVNATDDALFFFDKAMNSLEVLANKILSPKLNMGLNKIKFISDDYKDYMPAPDHLDGW